MQRWVCNLKGEVMSGLTEKEALKQSLEGGEQGSYGEI